MRTKPIGKPQKLDPPALGSFARTAIKRKLRVGVVGCGAVGALHAKAYLNNPSVEFAGMCDVNQERAREQAGKLGVPAYASISELVAKGRPELVSVVVRWSDLEKPVEECLCAGLNILSEKPISFDPAVILRLIRLADSQGLKFGVNFNQRFTMPSQWFRRLREQGQFGEMIYTLAQYNQSGGSDRFYALREHMIHQFDLWHYHIGEVHSVMAQAARPKGANAENRPTGVAGTLKFENSALGTFINGFSGVGGLVNYYEMVGTRGRGYCENFVGRALFRPAEGPALFQDPPWIGGGGDYWDSLDVHVHAMVAALLEDKPMPVPATAAFEAQCLCSAIVRAVETGQAVAVKQMKAEILNSSEAVK